jgi:(2R)-sulfolactate sulfo-lyase subunit alpha
VKGHFWIHAANDYVGVAVEDIPLGKNATGLYMDSGETIEVRSRGEVPLGHKISIKDIESGGKVIEYGEVIGAATKKIRAGDHVHVHNLKTLRWSR